jgi:hypothetical protein
MMDEEKMLCGLVRRGTNWSSFERRSAIGCRTFEDASVSNAVPSMSEPCVADRPPSFALAVAALIAACVLGVPAQASAGIVCKPVFKFNEVMFSAAQNQQRTWTATLGVDASRCAATSGVFEIKFVRVKEMGPDLLFGERFQWHPGQTRVSLDFWWDEAVLDYWIGLVPSCGCRE